MNVEEYKTRSIAVQNFLEMYGMLPDRISGKTAFYTYNDHLQTLLDRYYIKYAICKTYY